MIFFWILMAAFLGFGIAAIFAGWLKLKRNIYLLFYIPLTGAFIFLFIKSNSINIREILLYNWIWGLLATVLVSALMIKNVLSQPTSERRKGVALILDIAWPGFAYGLIDALLLSVLPILAVQSAFSASVWGNGFIGKIGIGIVAFIASCFVTFMYHAGYPEFRGKEMIWPLIGNGVLSIAYLLTMNPLAAILPHIAMHIAAMFHGSETTVQVPPHYNN
jgi:hypothetical protein